jgi:RNA polymerase sigma-70 factor (ECF subfamily)
MNLAPDDPIVRARSGAPDAWMALLQQHGPAVYGLCRRMSHDPDDAYQEVWEKVHRRIDQFDPHRAGSFRGWLLTLAHRTLIDRHRREGARATPVEVAEPLDAGPLDSALDAAIERRQWWDRIEAALPSLATPDRRALIMYHLEDRDLDEIAEFEGVPRGTVKSRLHRARCRLIALIGGTRDT